MLLVNEAPETLTIGVPSEGQQAYIAQENLGIVFDTLTKNLYQNPIESIVRELCNNGHDAMVDAGINPVVTIRFDSDDRSIHFIDQGTGMSPEVMTKIYLSLGESTKRQSDDFIGSFGIGSKSPLSYTSAFYINTVVDGVEYEYMYSKVNLIPEMELIDSTPTDKPNGTDVWFYLKPKTYSYYDQERASFSDAIKKQLKYFDSVILVGFPEITNKYTLYKGQHVIIRPNYANTSGFLEICFGKNVYPIDWAALGIEDKDKISSDCGLYFNIGELTVTPNREQIRYTEATKQAILAKIEAARKELSAMYHKKYSAIKTLQEYFYQLDNLQYLGLGTSDRLSLRGWNLPVSIGWAPIQHLHLSMPPHWEDILDCYTVKRNRSTRKKGEYKPIHEAWYQGFVSQIGKSNPRRNQSIQWAVLLLAKRAEAEEVLETDNPNAVNAALRLFYTSNQCRYVDTRFGSLEDFVSAAAHEATVIAKELAKQAELAELIDEEEEEDQETEDEYLLDFRSLRMSESERKARLALPASWELYNPKGIDYAAEIREFYELVRADITATMTDYDSLPIPRQDRYLVLRDPTEVNVSYNGDSQSWTTCRRLHELSHHRIICTDKEEAKMLWQLVHQHWGNRYSKSRKVKGKNVKVENKRLLSVIWSPAKYTKAMLAIPGSMTADDFLKSRMLERLLRFYWMERQFLKLGGINSYHLSIVSPSVHEQFKTLKQWQGDYNLQSGNTFPAELIHYLGMATRFSQQQGEALYELEQSIQEVKEDLQLIYRDYSGIDYFRVVAENRTLKQQLAQCQQQNSPSV